MGLVDSLFRGDLHGAKFPYFKSPALEADSFLTKENRPGRNYSGYRRHY